MGREIIRQDSNMVTEKQTRVWNADEALDLLITNQEKEKVEALHLELLHPTEHRFADEYFVRLPNLSQIIHEESCRSQSSTEHHYPSLGRLEPYKDGDELKSSESVALPEIG
ncbi:hypothetical protein NL676_022713 [Syzygium grande]|nr:hypothetical protein NL676_022713 [Syzygium grande]